MLDFDAFPTSFAAAAAADDDDDDASSSSLFNVQPPVNNTPLIYIYSSTLTHSHSHTHFITVYQISMYLVKTITLSALDFSGSSRSGRQTLLVFYFLCDCENEMGVFFS